jgi:hypothetical protein
VSGSSDVAITCVMPMAQVLYTGDEEGRVVSFVFSFTSISRHPLLELSLTRIQYEWDLVRREDKRSKFG